MRSDPDELDRLARYTSHVLAELAGCVEGDVSDLRRMVLQSASLACAMLVCLWAKLREQPCDAPLLAEHGRTVGVLHDLLPLVRGIVDLDEDSTVVRLARVGGQIVEMSLEDLSPAGQA